MRPGRRALLGAVAVTALLWLAAAGPASAASFWGIEFTKLSSGESESVACKRVGESNLKLRVTMVVEFELTATGAECNEGSIAQEGSNATGTLKLQLTGSSAMKPACQVSSFGSGTTALKFAPMKVGTTEYKRLEPVKGTTIFTFTTKSCSMSGFDGTYVVSGSLCGKGRETGTEFIEGKLEFSGAAQTAGGCELSVFGNPAVLEGELSTYLSGAKGGRLWGATE